MSYNKRTWTNGNVVGAVDLNRMEEGIANVDVGYSCSEGWVTLTEESITTTIEEGDSAAFGDFTSSELIAANTIKVTFNNTEYICSKVSFGEYNIYGGAGEQGLDFSEYSFAITSDASAIPVRNQLFTETAGTYQVKIETEEETITTTPCFEKAVRQCGRIVVSLYGDGYGSIVEASMTARDVKTLLDQGVDVVLYKYARLDSSDFEVEYFMKKDPNRLYYYDSVYGNIYRFSGLAFSYDNGGEEAMRPGYHTDIFNPDGTNDYYWVHEDYYAGKHE